MILIVSKIKGFGRLGVRLFRRGWAAWGWTSWAWAFAVQARPQGPDPKGQTPKVPDPKCSDPQGPISHSPKGPTSDRQNCDASRLLTTVRSCVMSCHVAG